MSPSFRFEFVVSLCLSLSVFVDIQLPVLRWLVALFYVWCLSVGSFLARPPMGHSRACTLCKL